MNVQKKIVRLICFKSYSDHSEPLFSDLKILNVYKIDDYLCSIFIFYPEPAAQSAVRGY
jgi:hypothetical protein